MNFEEWQPPVRGPCLEEDMSFEEWRSRLRGGMPVHLEGLGGLASSYNGAACFLVEWSAENNKWMVDIGGFKTLIGEQFMVP